MTFKLSRVQNKTLDAHIDELRELRGHITEIVGAFNAMIEEQGADLAALVERYNDALAEVAEFRDDLVAEMQDVYNEKTNRWQESDRGQAAYDFISGWEGIPLDEIDIEVPEPIVFECDHIEELETMERSAS